MTQQLQFCIESPPPDCAMVVFGASGDLTLRKLAPALYKLHQRNLLPEAFFLLGVARSRFNDRSYRDRLAESLIEHGQAKRDDPGLPSFIERCYYSAGDYGDVTFLKTVRRRVADLHREYGGSGNTVFYFAVPPALYADLIRGLGAAGLRHQRSEDAPWERVVVEKPFGHDLDSAEALDREFKKVLHEHQIYRIDHYLGKETVQNILMLRFANSVFEPIWNRRYVHHVEITVAEAIGIERRAGYYDAAGCLRDMFQNHMLQLLSLVAMEPPASFEADRVRDEKAKLLLSIRPITPEMIPETVVRGQYTTGSVDGRHVPGYREEPDVPPDSTTETFVALELLVDNWRWQGVPFLLRSGKRMKRRVSEIAITFRRVPHSIFRPLRPEDLTPNVLVLNVQPEEGVALTIQAKRPGPKLCMGRLTLSFRYREAFGTNPPDAYERLLLDCMQGDQTLFPRQDNIRLSWKLLGPILDFWARTDPFGGPCPLRLYPAGSWGPAAADMLPARHGAQWRTP